MEVTTPFASALKQQQVRWSEQVCLPESAFESRHGKRSWVLTRDQQARNLYRPEWWQCIAGKEHRWARALNSSQCFAVNLFGPLKDDPARTLMMLQKLLPGRNIQAKDSVSVEFEYTPRHAPEWLGESGQPTQVDVYLRVDRSGRCIGHILIEVKLSESSFGQCRGWNGKQNNSTHNPDRTRCEDIAAILASPASECWLAETEGRHYWTHIQQSGSAFSMDALHSAGSCPFRHGLYQIMRNRVLADELARHSGSAWSECVLCSHPANKGVWNLDQPVLGLQNALDAFRSLTSKDAIRDWNAKTMVAEIAAADPALTDWANWMNQRYFDEF